ncbi:MAG: metallophosphoesterase [Muribaculaceae bacterium]|nr:metallophosphoesterase [Muribaculaceae bacterium]
MKIGFIIVPIVALLAQVYVLWHVYHVLPFPAWGKWIVVALMVLALAMMFVGLFGAFDRMPLSLASVTYEISTSWLIVFLYLLITFVVLDLGRLVHLVPKDWLYSNAWTSGIITALIGGLLVYGNIHYNNKVREPLTLETGKHLTKPVKVVMVSDLHLGYHNRKAEWQRWMKMINDENPDLILVAGDIVDGYARPLIEENVAADFRQLGAPIVACLGNHEYITGIDKSLDFYEKAGITLLRDTTLTIGDLVIAGRDDLYNRRRKPVKQLLNDVDKEKFVILLDHQPYKLEEAQKNGVDFQFSGHTHEGQIWPLSLLVHRMYENAWGFCKKGDTRYYVSSGLGIWGGKYRIGTRSEYIVATITPKTD